MEITGKDIYWAPQPSSPIDPLAALQNHLALNDPLQVFAYKQGIALKPLRKKKFLGRINKALGKGKIEHIQGHSICIRSMLEYLLMGMSFKALKVKGRWSSDTYMKYLQAHTEIMAPFIQEKTKLREELIQRTIPPI
ncbi:hypothetical protein APHAL10511_008742, partial [Amanita phalloides]